MPPRPTSRDVTIRVGQPNNTDISTVEVIQGRATTADVSYSVVDDQGRPISGSRVRLTLTGQAFNDWQTFVNTHIVPAVRTNEGF